MINQPQLILKGLLSNEFSRLKNMRIHTAWKEPIVDYCWAWIDCKMKCEYGLKCYLLPQKEYTIYLRRDAQKSLLDITNTKVLTDILRHELLHIETLLPDGDDEFIAVAKKRKIPNAFFGLYDYMTNEMKILSEKEQKTAG